MAEHYNATTEKGGHYTVSMGDVSAKAPEIEILWREMEKETAVLLENLKGLEARLQYVLLPEVPQPIRNDSAEVRPAQPHSNMYNILSDIRYRITGASILINQIKERLEI
jgi:hypothetical protein